MLTSSSEVMAGTGVIMRNLCSGLEAYGIDSTAVVGGGGAYLLDLQAHGVPYVTIPDLSRGVSPLNDPKALVRLYRVLRKLEPDLLVCHDPKAGVLGRLLARRLGIPVVYTPHGWPLGEGVPRRQAAARLLVERASAGLLGSPVLNVCEHDRRLAIERGVGAEEDQLMVRNGIPDVDPAFRADPAAEPPRIVMIARFVPQKDHRTLLRALAELSEKRWTAELVGDGEGLAGSLDYCRQLGLQERVTFAGGVTRPQDNLARAQIFVLTSHWEGLPLTLLEAMRAGLPAVASDVGGVSEALEPGRTGFLVPRAGVSETAAALAELIDSPRLRREMGSAARKRYESEFTADRMLNDVAALFRKLVVPEGEEPD